ncbi:CRISPR-associated endonuclease Cas2 [Methanothermococcus okinawensis]|uniref:CRISPR-associated endoribonuclease Cas2 n=1 Tax=Methanothermococcus okinawensis (strain DSM 14208 / JCM 11175 / IH1) TaxID=647113 RepID=F8AMY6_METOI|nr:CRISPR-associated endonuclease Cas2 [Methanothermococcus okinawensis]AEH06109.1 CRISPR-associated protein Cas2 [Methanothermococcus okinawensis IH1]
MYVIIVYDVGVERVNKIKKFLRVWLNWVQNSVFEGELTESEYIKVEQGINNIIDKKLDSVIIFKLKDRKFIDRNIIGIDKNIQSDIL